MTDTKSSQDLTVSIDESRNEYEAYSLARSFNLGSLEAISTLFAVLRSRETSHVSLRLFFSEGNCDVPPSAAGRGAFGDGGEVNSTSIAPQNLCLPSE